MEVILSRIVTPTCLLPTPCCHSDVCPLAALCARGRGAGGIRPEYALHLHYPPPLPLIFTRETPPGHRCHLMPQLRRPCGCRIHYSVHGPSDGTPVLLLAPGGMRSCIANWMGQPYDPWSRLPGLGGGSKYKVVAMDQRAGAGDSDHLPLPTSWATFRDDQLAVLDATAGDRKCLLVGSCIG